MELKIPNKLTDEPFKLEYTPLTLDLYFERFHRDLIADVTEQLQVYGGLPRSLSIRVIWACCVSADHTFLEFRDFIDILDYNIHEYSQTWGKDFSEWFYPLMNREVDENSKV